MFKLFKKSKPTYSTTEAIDIIENIVFDFLKEHKFKKFGRTLHRFVSEDISQVINFQVGLPSKNLEGRMCINIGIRVPECQDRTFYPAKNSKKYYHEYDCNIRTRLKSTISDIEIWYDLKDDPQKTGNIILNKIKKDILPLFEALSNRDAILRHRKDYFAFDDMNHLILLEESMIYGSEGNIEAAADLFNKYYQKALNEYENEVKNGKQIYLKSGEVVISGGQSITADKDGYYTLFCANDSHLQYIRTLAKELNIELK